MQYILFEDSTRYALQPFTFLRPIYQLRMGLYTFEERWVKTLNQQIHSSCVRYLQSLFQSNWRATESIWINGGTFPEAELLTMMKELAPNTYLLNQNEKVLAARFYPSKLPTDFSGVISIALLEEIGLNPLKVNLDIFSPSSLSDLFRRNGEAIRKDVAFAVQKEQLIPLSDQFSILYGKDNIFLEEGAQVRAAILNAENGPIYLRKGAHVQEGAIIRGAHAIGEYAQINLGAKLRGDSSIGPHSKVGGEVSNSVVMGYSNKSHDGYLGNSVLGYWCNLGADTNTSNLKNNYSFVRQWNYEKEEFSQTDLQFCGLVFGDHSKCGINTMFNTATVVGVCANIFGGNFPPKFVPSFSWGGDKQWNTYSFEKASKMVEMVKMRKNHAFDQKEKELLYTIFQKTAKYRNWKPQTVNAIS